jgi:hypothetical protein
LAVRPTSRGGGCGKFLRTGTQVQRKTGTWQTVRLQFKLKISNLDQHRKDVLQILGCNVTAGVWAEIPENMLVEGAIVDVDLV